MGGSFVSRDARIYRKTRMISYLVRCVHNTKRSEKRRPQKKDKSLKIRCDLERDKHRTRRNHMDVSEPKLAGLGFLAVFDDDRVLLMVFVELGIDFFKLAE